jgi:hypothetical protein
MIYEAAVKQFRSKNSVLLKKQVTFNQRVNGSNPFGLTKINNLAGEEQLIFARKM